MDQPRSLPAGYSAVIWPICSYCGKELRNGDRHVKAPEGNSRGLKCLVLINLAGESNCSCDQRGRNISCERCRPTQPRTS